MFQERRSVDVELMAENILIKTLESVGEYDEMLRDILASYGMGEAVFEEKRHVKLFKILGPIPGVLVKFFRQEGQETPDEIYTIRTLFNSQTRKVRGLSIARFIGDSGDGVRVDHSEMKEEVETRLSVRALLEWCAMVQQWKFKSDKKNKEREYSGEKYVDKLIESLRPIPITSPTAREHWLSKLLTLQPPTAGCYSS